MGRNHIESGVWSYHRRLVHASAIVADASAAAAFPELPRGFANFKGYQSVLVGIRGVGGTDVTVEVVGYDEAGDAPLVLGTSSAQASGTVFKVEVSEQRIGVIVKAVTGNWT